MKQVVKWAAVPFVLLAGTAFYVLRPVNIEREWGVRPPTLPSPNGYDLILQSRSLFSTTSERVNEKFIYVDEIFGFVRPKNEAEARRLYPTARKIKWVKTNEAAYAASERALKVPFVTPPRHLWKDHDEVYALRSVANYWRVKAKAYAETNESEKAIDVSLNLFDLSSYVRGEGEVTTMLMGNAIEAGARDVMTREIAKLNSAQAAKAARRMEKILKRRQPLATHFAAERSSGVFEIHETYQQAIKEMLEPPLFADENQPAPQLPFKIRLLNMTGNVQKRLLIGEYALAMDGVIEKSGGAWATRESAVPAASLNPVVPKLIKVLEGARFFYENSNVNADLMLTRLALHAYRKQVGRYPVSLNELTPKYLEKVPLDAFSGEILRYRREGKSYKLWSVGPDSRDDNARPALNAQSLRPTTRYLVKADAQGDIVANINN